MKVFVVFSILAVSAYGARLDNRYIPPPANAQSAGGFNLDTPRQALPSNIQNTYTAPGVAGLQTNYQQQNYQRPGANQQTYTSQTSGNGYNAVSAGSFVSSSNAQPNFQRPAYQQQQQQQTVQRQQQPTYQQAQPSYNYQPQSDYNQATTTPIPILKCE